MRRRTFVLAGLATAVSGVALAAKPKRRQRRWMVRIKGWLCTGCGRKLQNKLAELKGIAEATVDVKSGEVQLLTTNKEVTETVIRKTIEKTNFKVVDIQGPVPTKRRRSR